MQEPLDAPWSGCVKGSGLIPTCACLTPTLRAWEGAGLGVDDVLDLKRPLTSCLKPGRPTLGAEAISRPMWLAKTGRMG